MKDSVKKGIFLGAIVAIIALYFVISELTQVENFYDKYEGVDLTADSEGAVRQGTYSRYMTTHQDATLPDAEVVIDVTDYIAGEDVETYSNYEGADKALYTGSASSVTWEVNIPETGFYNVWMKYYTVESRGVAVERAIYINDELPFEDAANLSFSRIWTNDGEVRVDNQGNEIRPPQVEVFDWQSSYFRDDMGYIVEPYQFYFEKGKNTITLKAVNEPVVLGELVVKGVADVVTYEDYLAQVQGKDATGDGLTHYRWYRVKILPFVPNLPFMRNMTVPHQPHSLTA